MAQLKQFISPSVVVRNIMRAHGKQTNEIWTNAYPKCWTVKCYAGSLGLSVELDKELVEEVTNALTLIGVTGFKIKRKWIKDSIGPSIIVRIPRDPVDLIVG